MLYVLYYCTVYITVQYTMYNVRRTWSLYNITHTRIHGIPYRVNLKHIHTREHTHTRMLTHIYVCTHKHPHTYVQTPLVMPVGI